MNQDRLIVHTAPVLWADEPWFKRLIEAEKERRAALTPEQRELEDRIEREVDLAFLYGTDRPGRHGDKP